jgi:hypothetical protein
MSSPATAAPQLRSANAFTLISHSGTTKVVYYPDAPGPFLQGLTPGAVLEYSGPEGKHTFRSAQISRQDTPSGQLLSVVLKPQFDLGSLAFSFFLPFVNIGASGIQHFTTYGVKAHHAGSRPRAGAQICYEPERFRGEAKNEIMPR